MTKRAALLSAGLLGLLGYGAPVLAQSESHGNDLGVAVRVGTVGLGVEVSKWITGHLGARFGANLFTKNFKDRELSGNHYDAQIKVHAVMALADIYLSRRGAFHFTAGLSTNPARVTATGTPSGGNFEINNHPYTSSQVGVLTAEAKFKKMAPYVGLGFGTAARGGRLAFVFDLGVALGKPRILLTATGAASNAQLQNDLNAEIADAQQDANKLPGYPVLSLGLMYRF